MELSEAQAREYKEAAAVIHAVLAGAASRSDVREQWPDSTDPTLVAARAHLDLWFLGELKQDPGMRAEHEVELENIASALASGKFLVGDRTERTWSLLHAFQDNAVGLLFVVAVVLLLTALVWAAYVFRP